MIINYDGFPSIRQCFKAKPGIDKSLFFVIMTKESENDSHLSYKEEPNEKTNHKNTFWLSCTLVSLTALSACSANSNNTKSSSSAETATLKDAAGHEVTIPDDPKRIIGSYLEDYLVALNVTPVAQWTVGNNSDQGYLQEKLSDVPRISYDLPYEDVLSYEPDLLLIDSNTMVEGDKYAQYSKIAPTYVVKMVKCLLARPFDRYRKSSS